MNIEKAAALRERLDGALGRPSGALAGSLVPLTASQVSWAFALFLEALGDGLLDDGALAPVEAAAEPHEEKDALVPVAALIEPIPVA